MRHVRIAWRSARSLESVRTWVNGPLLDTLRRAGYTVESETATANSNSAPGTECIVLRETRSLWLLTVSWLAFLFSKNRYQAVLSLSPLADGRTELLVAGDVPGQVAKQLKKLAEPIRA